MSDLQSASIKSIAAALVAAQKDMDNASLNKRNPHFNSKYADLPSIREAILGPLNDNGLALSQTMAVSPSGESFALVTTLMHGESGEWIKSIYPLPQGKPHDMGSAITYARRYAAGAMVFVASDEDDDANVAQEQAVRQIATPAQKTNVVALNPQSAAKDWQQPIELGFGGSFIEFGAALVGHIEAAKSEAEIREWTEKNDDLITQMETRAPRVYSRLIERVAKIVKEINITAGRSNKTDARDYEGPAKSASGDIELYRIALLAVNSPDELDEVYSRFSFTKQNTDQAVDMLEQRRKSLMDKKAA